MFSSPRRVSVLLFIILILPLCFSSSFLLSAEENEEDQAEIDYAGIFDETEDYDREPSAGWEPFDWNYHLTYMYLLWGADLLPTGIDLSGQYGWRLWGNRETIIYGYGGAGYDGHLSWRLADGYPRELMTQDELSLHSLDDPSRYLSTLTMEEMTELSQGRKEYDSVFVPWRIGIKQGFVYSPETDRNLLEGMLLYKGKYEQYLDGRSLWQLEDYQDEQIEDYHALIQNNSVFYDNYGVINNAIMAGLSVDYLQEHPSHRTKDGIYAELTVEWSPGKAAPEKPAADTLFISSDYLRLNFTAIGYITLFDLYPDRKNTWFTITLADCFFVDYLYGDYIPQYISQHSGGTFNWASGNRVRGFEKMAYDTNLKIVNNLELRINLPAIYVTNLVPCIFGYFDIGYFYRYHIPNQPDLLEDSLLMSAGVGMGFDLFTLLDLVLTFQFPFYGGRMDGDIWKFGFDMEYHF